VIEDGAPYSGKVLFCGPIDEPLNSGRYMIAGINQLGYTVIGYDYRTHTDYEQDILRIIVTEKPEFVFVLKGEKFSPEFAEKVRQSGCVTILWFTTLSLEEWMIPLARAFDFVVVNADHNMFSLLERGIEHVTWIHQGFAPEFFGISNENEVSPSSEYYADVAMIGSMGKPIYKTRSELVARIRKEGINIKWWGPRLCRQVRNAKYFYAGVHRSWAGSEAYMEDFADVIRHIKIFIGQDADTAPSEEKYLSNRSFAVMGCGGFYLCRRTSGIESIYNIGREMDVFDTEDEMVEKVRYYLDNEDERRTIALAGQRRVLTEYTYDQQMRKIFNWVLHTLKGQR
jgi:hypothetical protein